MKVKQNLWNFVWKKENHLLILKFLFTDSVKKYREGKVKRAKASEIEFKIEYF